MADERPRPRYGEYATPQDQAKSIAESLPPVSPLLAPHDRPAAVPTTSETANSESTPAVSGASTRSDPPAPAAGGSTPGPGASAPSKAKVRIRRRWDVILSVALLAYGLFVVIAALVQPLDVAGSLDEVYRVQGIGNYTSAELAQSIGLGITFSNVVIFAMTLVVTLRFLQAKRISFYWPIIGGATAAIIGGVLLFVAIMGDPAFSAYVGNAG